MVEKNNGLPEISENLKVKIGIIGYGIVGMALAGGFNQDHISYFDKYKPSRPLEKVVKDSEFIFICLPTPMFADESGIDLSIIEENIAKITPLTKNTDKIIVIKSTVVPGTTEKFEKKYPKSKFAFNPEFLTEANSFDDFKNADRTIIGASNNLVSRRLAMLYQIRFPKSRIYQTDPTSAEMVKYMANAYLATKVIFANQMDALCQSLGIRYEEVKKMVVADQRIEDTHLDVTTERGFGGKCFPKDIVALIAEADKRGVDLSLVKEVWKINKHIRQKHDWVEIPFATSEKNDELG
ncbi:UDP-glucose/GDP-mannose dehydrogenase family protein [Candidatus Daviesbacteria bacterium]|nr:UDP-glucose/GDP-mannose dehydrogenase family protein [Candidatus Daviesbacteria bacterium]